MARSAYRSGARAISRLGVAVRLRLLWVGGLLGHQHRVTLEAARPTAGDVTLSLPAFVAWLGRAGPFLGRRDFVSPSACAAEAACGGTEGGFGPLVFCAP